MSRKDYEALARVIRAQVESLDYEEQDDFAEYGDSLLRKIAHDVADVLYQDNPRFNREKFLHAALGGES